MLNDLTIVEKAALLADIERICIRVATDNKSLQEYGIEYICPSLKGSPTGQQILHCTHALREDSLKMNEYPKDDLSYIVHEATVVASAKEENKDLISFEEDFSTPLENIFNLFDGAGEKSYFAFKSMEEINFPQPKSKVVVSRDNYVRLIDSLRESFQNKIIEEISPNELLRILENTVINVPYSINSEDTNDVSLYDHARITAAVATSLFRYCNTYGITDYQEFCWNHAKANRSVKTMLFISADFSGIQKFIYRVHSKGALRMLRGRSFYLDIVLENVVDELLEKLSLSRANLIYCGGGHFYVLADNTKETKKVLQDSLNEVNHKLAEMFSASLYLAFAWEEICADDLMIQKTWQKRNIFQKVGEKLSVAKQKRYDAKTLAELFNPNNPINIARKDSRECGLCHRSVSSLKPYIAQINYGETNSIEVCDVCNGLYQLGKDILEHKTLFVVVEGSEKPDNSVALPSSFGNRFLVAVNVQSLDAFKEKGSILRVYEKNEIGMTVRDALRIWVGDYAAEKDNKVLDLSDFAHMAGAATTETGIKRLGVLRADVDNLGAAFVAGLRKTEHDNPDCYATLSRYSTLSRQLTMFFKKTIIDVCKKQLPEGVAPFYLFNNKGSTGRLLHIIYSGGDDLFLVGAWDDLLEFAIDLRNTFRVYTNGKLSFSAGLGLFGSKYPISRIAEAAGKLEDAAKELEGKDGIALFGEHTEYRNTKVKEKVPLFKWSAFEEKVCKEKLHFLLQHFALEGMTEDTGKNLQVGKSLLYRLMVLLTTPRNSGFNLARFAYTIARLEPDKKRNTDRIPCYQEVRKKLFRWAQSEEDKLEMVAAIQLIIYRMRDKQ